MRLASLDYHGPCAPFEALGFHVSPESTVVLQDVTIHIHPSLPGQPLGFLPRWGWTDLPSGVAAISGLRCYAAPGSNNNKGCGHPNTAFAIDHVVLYVSDEQACVDSFAKAGISLARRTGDVFPDVSQLFFRPGGGTIIEVLATKGEHAHPIWGLTLAVKDLDLAKARLGKGDELVSGIRVARQKGRRILTVRHEAVGLHTNMAWMTEHVKAGAKM
jgi:catechol 2,3-dioxygenase-like lactoylglutathione lyase family enzyme